MSTTLHPEVCWAQRSNATEPEKNLLYLTIVATDVPKESVKIEVNSQSISFTGENPKTKVKYEFQIELYEEIDTDHTKTLHTSRSIQLTLRKKKAAQEFWPRLTKAPIRNAFIKTDFDKWVDEDSQEEASADLGEGFDDMGGMGGMGGMPGMGDMSSLMGGGDLSNMDLSSLGGDEDEEAEDADMPELEDEKEEAPAVENPTSSKDKITEVS